MKCGQFSQPGGNQRAEVVKKALEAIKGAQKETPDPYLSSVGRIIDLYV